MRATYDVLYDYSEWCRRDFYAAHAHLQGMSAINHLQWINHADFQGSEHHLTTLNALSNNDLKAQLVTVQALLSGAPVECGVYRNQSGCKETTWIVTSIVCPQKQRNARSPSDEVYKIGIRNQNHLIRVAEYGSFSVGSSALRTQSGIPNCV